MKRLLGTTLFILFFTANSFAQKDSSKKANTYTMNVYGRVATPAHSNDSIFHNSLFIKFNPCLAVDMGYGGEVGGTIQYNIGDSVAIFMGAGYNEATPAMTPTGSYPQAYPLNTYTGYTVRGGVYIYVKKHKFVSFQGFYRVWNKGFGYEFPGDGGGTSFDKIGDPISSISDGANENRFSVYNYSATVASLSILFGRQSYFKPLLLEWYIGAGARIKNIDSQEIGDYDPGSQQFFPNTANSSTGQSTYFFVSFGAQIGVRL